MILEIAMTRPSIGLLTSATVMLGAALLASQAQAQDFLSALFGAFGVRPPPMVLPFASQFPSPMDAQRAHIGAGGQAWCVRTCDGRYFPIQGADRQSRATSCNSFCPAAQTELFYGGEIDDSVTETGKPYSELSNAYRYRSELVAGCTCNGKDPVGLARVAIENDPTLRRGDIVAGQGGLAVKGGAPDKHAAAANFSPVPDQVRARYKRVRVPVVAAE
jgi:hypothetical protein